jgi:hypothetical protein
MVIPDKNVALVVLVNGRAMTEPRL